MNDLEKNNELPKKPLTRLDFRFQIQNNAKIKSETLERRKPKMQKLKNKFNKEV